MFILYPENRTSPIQEAQMCAYDDENVTLALRAPASTTVKRS